jgi:chloride channel protein, CIC family
VTLHEPTGLPTEAPGDFTATPRLLLLAAIAGVLGIISAYLSVALLTLINACTNLFFYQRFSLAPASPAMHTLGPPCRWPAR